MKAPQSETVERTIRRLKRDDPDLAKQVIAGEVTANAAAREKGWRKPRIVLSTPERVATSLLTPRVDVVVGGGEQAGWLGRNIVTRHIGAHWVLQRCGQPRQQRFPDVDAGL